MIEDYEPTPGREVKMFRYWMGWSQAELAGWLRAGTSQVSHWEGGVCPVPVSVVYLLRVVMRCGITNAGDPVGQHEVFNPITEDVMKQLSGDGEEEKVDNDECD